MSKHVWTTKPSEGKAQDLALAFRTALEGGVAPALSRIFAGYYCEYRRQTGRVEAADLLSRVGASGYKFSKGKNAGNYSKCFAQHLPFFVAPLAESVGLASDAPYFAVADALEEEGRTDDALFVRACYRDDTAVPAPAVRAEQERTTAGALSVGDRVTLRPNSGVVRVRVATPSYLAGRQGIPLLGGSHGGLRFYPEGTPVYKHVPDASV